MEEVEIIENSEELEKALQSVNPNAWKMAQMKVKGKSLIQIREEFGGLYDIQDISYMLKKVVAINQALALKNPELLRQLLIDEIDSVKNELYITNAGIMTEKMANVLLRMIEAKAKLLGLNAPEVHKVDLVQTIKAANESLAEKRANFLKSRGVIIDVTPGLEAQSTTSEAILSSPKLTAKEKILEKIKNK